MVYVNVPFSNVDVHTGSRITACGVETQTHLSHAMNLVILNDLFGYLVYYSLCISQHRHRVKFEDTPGKSIPSSPGLFRVCPRCPRISVSHYIPIPTTIIIMAVLIRFQDLQKNKSTAVRP